MGWYREWTIPDEWTHKPVWLPPYPIPYGFWGNITPFYTKKEVIDGEKPWKPRPNVYYFFDTPDFADCHKKVYSYGVFGTKVAAFTAGLDVLANRQLNYWNAVGRASSHFGRVGGSFLLYAAITCSVANLRGKKHDTWEQPWNHIIGGASVGLIWGYKYHSTSIGCLVAVAGAIFGILNLRANTPTETHPKGWQILFPDNIDDVYIENGSLGGRNYRDLRVGWKINDPGRTNLE